MKLINEPKDYFELFLELPEAFSNRTDDSKMNDFIHYFTKSALELEKNIQQLKQEIEQDGIIWISWPKKASKVETDLDGNIVRTIGLNSGLVDIKVCAINEMQCGLKFVIPVKDRK
ncbi:DUF3052 domain-containing protein [Maribacter litopenaei]|uniref:DUF3052 domain-containing protein n=1 Tax=Maribacter litopenaei TaxID=2976127 RepID=A0ABY5YB95_9FLAO|nr:DUF3052 domain-containing protein [Maribacter litopenaei]UWX56335.1 DUF3052 domain-containing protein [Maribacter litopenaei]